jgi:hypothetical protein
MKQKLQNKDKICVYENVSCDKEDHSDDSATIQPSRMEQKLQHKKMIQTTFNHSA